MSRGTVIVVGGGNAGLCAALTARESGANVVLLEAAPRHLRGGNSRHTRNIRTAHLAGDDYVTGPYAPDELAADVRALNEDDRNAGMIELLVEGSLSAPAWMMARGVRWQAPLRGTLHLSRTNHFFLGGGKTLVNAYYRTAERIGVDIRYEAKVVGLEMAGSRCSLVVVGSPAGHGSVRCDAVVIASGGFEANIAWLSQYWGDAAQNFIIRGTPYNEGAMLRCLLDLGARAVGDPSRFHAIAVDARAPRFDGGIVTRLDTVPVGIVVNGRCERFADEGEDIWPKRYAQWGRLIAQQDGQMAYSILDGRWRHTIMPPVYPPFEAATVEELAVQLELDPAALAHTVAVFNAHTQRDRAPSLDKLDGCGTIELDPPKSNWAAPLEQPPFVAFPLRPGITFTYHGVAIDRSGRVETADGALENVYAAGEVMSGNVMTRGYIAGIGMTVGTVFGRIAGKGAATHA